MRKHIILVMLAVLPVISYSQTAAKASHDATDVAEMRSALMDAIKSAASGDDKDSNEDLIGGLKPNEKLPVDIELITSSDKPTVGELWTIFGEIKNRSDKSVWIVDSKFKCRFNCKSISSLTEKTIYTMLNNIFASRM